MYVFVSVSVCVCVCVCECVYHSFLYLCRMCSHDVRSSYMNSQFEVRKSVCVCVCVCVYEREREKALDGKR